MGEPFRGGGRETLVAQWFAGADTDHDGRLSRAEFRADAARFFRTLDTDGNGELSADEVRRYETEVAPEIRVGSAGGGRQGAAGGGRGGGGHGGHHGGGFGGGGGRGGGGGGGGEHSPGGGAGGGDVDRVQGGGRFGLLNIPEPVASADTDFNRTVSLAEFKAAADRRFDLLDPDGNGVLTLAGLPHRGPAGGDRRPL